MKINEEKTTNNVDANGMRTSFNLEQLRDINYKAFVFKLIFVKSSKKKCILASII